MRVGSLSNSSVTKLPATEIESISYPFELYIETISNGDDNAVEFLITSTEITDPPDTLALSSIPLVSFLTINFGELLYFLPPVVIPM